MSAEVRPRTFLLAGALIALAGCASNPAPLTSLPLDDLRAAVGTATQERRREAAAVVENALAQCMHEQGFEYVPTPRVAEQELPAEDARDFAARWGYGISTATTAPRITELPPMSPAEEEAYLAALHGERATDTERDPAAGPGDGGCWEAANAARGREPGEAAATALLAAELEVLEMSISVDLRVADQNAAWSDCMADGGFDIDGPEDAPQAAITAGQAIEATATDPATSQVLSEIQDLERQIAVADLDCQDEVDFADTMRAVRAEHEAAFVEQHGPEIEALVAMLTRGGAPARPAP